MRIGGTPPIQLCIHAEPNRLGIDFARIELRAATVRRLLTLYKLALKNALLNVCIGDLELSWVRTGALCTEKFDTTVTVAAFDEEFLWLYVDAIHVGAVNADGEFENNACARGVWMVAVRDLTSTRLASLADEYGDVWAACDVNAAAFTYASDLAEFGHAMWRWRIRAKAMPVDAMLPAPWPNAFPDSVAGSLSNTPSRTAAGDAPPAFTRGARSVVAEEARALLFDLARTATLDPNARCAVLILAAALITQPETVVITEHRNPATTPPARVLRLCYQSLVGVLTLASTESMAHWQSLSTHHPNLALLYEDHHNNIVTAAALKACAATATHDEEFLVMLEYGIESLQRRFRASGGDAEDAWCEAMEAAVARVSGRLCGG